MDASGGYTPLDIEPLRQQLALSFKQELPLQLGSSFLDAVATAGQSADPCSPDLVLVAICAQEVTVLLAVTTASRLAGVEVAVMGTFECCNITGFIA